MEIWDLGFQIIAVNANCASKNESPEIGERTFLKRDKKGQNYTPCKT